MVSVQRATEEVCQETSDVVVTMLRKKKQKKIQKVYKEKEEKKVKRARREKIGDGR